MNCEKCIYREHKKKLLAYAVADLKVEWIEFLRACPPMSWFKHEDHECEWFQEDKECQKRWN